MGQRARSHWRLKATDSSQGGGTVGLPKQEGYIHTDVCLCKEIRRGCIQRYVHSVEAGMQNTARRDRNLLKRPAGSAAGLWQNTGTAGGVEARRLI